VSLRSRMRQLLAARGAKAARAGRPAQPRGPAGRPSYLASGLGERVRGFVPLDPKVSFKLYRDMRCCFPVLDVAITKLVRLAGGIVVEADEATRQELEAWLRGVRVNALGRGFQSWLEVHLDQMMLYGKSAGEIVLNHGRTEVYALTNLDATTVAFRTVPERPLELEVVQWQGGRPVVIPAPYALVSAHNPQGDSPHGVSLYRSLPLVAEALSVIENATVQVWQRMGAPPYHVNWKPDAQFADPDGSLTAAFMQNIQSSFQASLAARTGGAVHDFFSSGDVSVDVIGSPGTMLALAEPFRAFAEQVVAATGLPSWMFGFSWSTTERLSTQQADLIVANVEAIRRSVQPVIEQLIDLRQRLRGAPAPRRLGWSPVNLRDLTEQARGEAWQEQARARRIENGRRMWELGYWTQLQAARDADPTLAAPATLYPTPPTAAEHLPAGLSPTSEGG